MKKFSLYNKRKSMFVVAGLLLYHILVVGLCAFFCYKFLWLDYDPTVIILLLLIISLTAWCDIKGAQITIMRRFLCRCSFDVVGIQCYAPFVKKWTICWNDIHSFGVVGYNNVDYNKLAFFSTRSYNSWNNNIVSITREQIVFEVNEEIWEAAAEHMPTEVLVKMQRALDLRQDRFYRR